MSDGDVEKIDLQATDDLFGRIASILDSARGQVVRAVNHETVSAYWHIESGLSTWEMEIRGAMSLHQQFPTHRVGNCCLRSTPI